MKNFSRSFGFPFRDALFQGSLYTVNNKLEIYIFFAGQEYESVASFLSSNPVNQDEEKYLNDQINKLINAH